MNKGKFITILLTALLAVTMVSCATTATTNEPRTISVSGSGEVALSADMASFSVSFSNTADTTKEAQTLTNTAMQRVYDILENEYGVSKDDIRTTSMNLSPRYSWLDGVQTLVGQTASQSIDVNIYDLSLLGSIMDSLSEITGIEFSSIQLGLQDNSEALMHARIKAIDDAKAKAADYADASGMTVLNPISISDNSGSYVYANYAPTALMARSVADESASALYYESDVKVSASVSVVFEMTEAN